MGIKDIIEEAAGAFAADKALEAVDPNAGLLAKGAAAIAGFEGVGVLKEKLEGTEEKSEEQPSDSADADEGQADDNA